MNEGLNLNVLSVEDDRGMLGPNDAELRAAKLAVNDYARRQALAGNRALTMRQQISGSVRDAMARAKARKLQEGL